MPEMICPYCQREFPGNYKWCMDDGSELEQNLGQYSATEDDGSKVPCPECGEPVDVRDIFCGNCATRLEGRLPQPEREYEEEPEYEEPPAPVQPPRRPAQAPAAPAVEQAPGATRPCPKCGGDVGLADTFCGICGAELESAIPATMFDGTIQGRVCPHCAAGLEPTDTYCGACGRSVEPEVAPAALALCASCGMEIGPEDTFCGTCGSPVGEGETFEPAAAPPAAGAAGGTCPSCGMQVGPGDTFCGVCGAPFGEQLPERIISAEAPAPKREPAAATPEPAEGGAMCPNCGMDTAPGDTFCATCGSQLGGAETAPHEEEELVVISESPEADFVPEEAFEDVAPAAAGGSMCPNCGMDVAPGDTFCGTCGGSIGEGEVLEPVPEEFPADGLAVDTRSSIADVTADIPVCPVCGIEGEPGQDVCVACGSAMTTEGNLDPGLPGSGVEMLEPLKPVEYAVPAAVDSTAGVGTASGEKICSCCGTCAPQDAEFCSNCGVDF